MEVCLTMFKLFMKSGAKVLLERYVKRFIGELSVNQISLSSKYFQHCCVKLTEVNFITEEINAEIECLKLPIAVVDCFAREINLEVDLTSSEEFITAKVSDLILTLNVSNSYVITGSSLMDPTSSAGESDFFSEVKDSDFVKLMAQLHKSICHKLTIDIKNFKVRFQFISKEGNVGIAIEVNAAFVNFCNRFKNIEDDIKAPVYDNKILKITDLEFLIEEFMTLPNKQEEIILTEEEGGDIEVDHLLIYSKDIIPFCQVLGKQEFIFGYKLDDSFGPDIDLQLMLGSIHIFLTPKQIQQVITAIDIFTNDIKYKSDNKWQISSNAEITGNDYEKVDVDINNLMEQNRPEEPFPFKESWSCQPAFDYTDTLEMNNKLKHSVASSSFYSVSSELEDKTMLHTSKNESITHFMMTIDAINAVILYEDLLLKSNDEIIPFIANSITDLQNKANDFFNHVKRCMTAVDRIEDISNIRNSLLDACPLNHFMLLIIPFKLCIQNKFYDTKYDNVLELSIGCLELYENLKIDNYMSRIIELNQMVKFSKAFSALPILTLQQSGTFAYTNKQKCFSKSNVSVSLGDCVIRLDFTIINRLNIFIDMFKKAPIHSKHNAMHNDFNDSTVYLFSIYDDENKVPINISVKASKLTCIIHFPFPDCTVKTLSLAPRLRKEVVILQLEKLQCQAAYDSSSSSTKYEFFLDEVSGFFQEKEDYLKIPIIRLSKNINEKIMITIELHTSVTNAYMNQPDNNLKKTVQTVFMTKTVVSQCLHKENSVKKELLLPADVRYVECFFDEAKQNTSINLEANIPYAQVSIPNKHTYEVLYNRFFIDLFVWCTEVPLVLNEKDNKGPYYFPNSPDTLNYNRTKSQSLDASDVDKPLLFSIGVFIGEAEVSIRTPYKEHDKVFVGKHGEIILKLLGGNLLLTNKYKKDKNITYLCMNCELISLLHQTNCNTVSTRSLNDNFDLSGFDEIIFPTETGFDLIDMKKDPTGRCLLLSMEISYNLKRKVSRTILACGLFGVTLNYKMHPLETIWFNQLADVFQIEYASIRGYEHPCELTEVNFFVSDCLVAYSPLNLPLKSIVSIGTVWLSVTSSYSSEKLSTHIFFEDSGVFLSKNLTNRITNADFVCVIHLGYFELCHNGGNKNEAELSISNSSIHIRTCSDSAIALMDLIVYLSNGGDLIQEPVDMKMPKTAQNVNYLSAEDVCIAQAHMEDELEDALKDFNTTSPQSSNKNPTKCDIKEISFPKRRNFSLHEQNSLSPDLSDLEDDIEIIKVVGDNDFCVIGSDIGTGIQENLQSSQLVSLIPMEATVKIEKHAAPCSKYQLNGVIKEMSIIWHLYGGKDFSNIMPITATANVRPVSYGHLMKQDSSCNIDYATNNRNHTSESKMWFCERGGKGRAHDKVMEVSLQRMRLKFDSFPKESNYSTCVDLLIKNIEIIDRISMSSINKFLYEDPQNDYPLPNEGYMMRIKTLFSKEQVTPMIESSISVSMRPLRLNVDQHALVHLSKFFTELISNDSAELGRVEQPSIPVSDNSTLTIYVDGNPYLQTYCDSDSNEKTETYIKEFTFHPAVPIKLDYEGKGFLNSQYGPMASLFIGLGRLNHSEFKLKKLSYNGIVGFNQLLTLMTNDWLDDIKQNQVGSIVGGVGPLRAFAELFGGLRDLIVMPVQQYREDGSILTGVRRGTSSFASSSAHATLDLAEKFLGCIQSIAEVMHDIVSQGPREKRKSYVMATPPQDIRDGINTAIGIISEGLGSTAKTVYRAALEEHSYKGMTGAVGGVIRQLPPAVMDPIILASEATCTVIEGVKSQLNPIERREAMEKWKK